MHIFITQYPVGDAYFNFFLIAKDWEEAQEIASSRGIGEVVLGQIEIEHLPDFLKIEKSGDILHLICFLSYLVLKSGKATPEQILGDRGVLHEMIHVLTGSHDSDTLKTLNQKIDWLFNLAGVTVSSRIGDAIGPVGIPL